MEVSWPPEIVCKKLGGGGEEVGGAVAQTVVNQTEELTP